MCELNYKMRLPQNFKFEHKVCLDGRFTNGMEYIYLFEESQKKVWLDRPKSFIKRGNINKPINHWMLTDRQQSWGGRVKATDKQIFLYLSFVSYGDKSISLLNLMTIMHGSFPSIHKQFLIIAMTSSYGMIAKQILPPFILKIQRTMYRPYRSSAVLWDDS